MNFKSITTIGLVAVALAVTSLAPAQANNNNNNKYLNQLAMQMYAQNQARAANPALNPALNPTLNPALYGSVLPASYNTYTGYQTPWSAGCTGGANYNNYGYNGYNNAYGNVYNNSYNNLLSPQYTANQNKIANLRAKLATVNPNSWTAYGLQKQINKLVAQNNSLATSGYGAPYGYQNSLWGNLRANLGI